MSNRYFRLTFIVKQNKLNIVATNAVIFCKGISMGGGSKNGPIPFKCVTFVIMPKYFLNGTC